ncbi:uncharacterized protein LOC128712810 [Anopheles marshallii]|uniref:uncharacterized protein LOC128712810 n=1 Tax=Anopheles marshallii TaxID=1521116 RepID=UPI00237BE070|nr:uncharacterized protein LOC128712810 [Anopheles marshallii]
MIIMRRVTSRFSFLPYPKPLSSISEQSVLLMEQDSANYSSSGEETEDASETEMWFIEQQQDNKKYQAKRVDLLHQLELAEQRKHPVFLQILANLQSELDDRLLLNEIERDSALASANRDCLREETASEQEFAEKKAKLIANAISDLEQEKKMLRHEIDAMGLTGIDKNTVSPRATRQLRPRLCDSVSMPQPVKISYLLSKEDIEHDLQLIRAGIEASVHEMEAVRYQREFPAISATIDPNINLRRRAQCGETRVGVENVLRKL